MAEPSCLCPVCGRETFVRPARWQACPHCHGKVLVPSVLRPTPAGHGPCAICGDLVLLQTEDDDAVCTPCYDANLRGGYPVERPTVAPLVATWAVRRRELQARDVERWPLTQGRAPDAL